MRSYAVVFAALMSGASVDGFLSKIFSRGASVSKPRSGSVGSDTTKESDDSLEFLPSKSIDGEKLAVLNLTDVLSCENDNTVPSAVSPSKADCYTGGKDTDKLLDVIFVRHAESLWNARKGNFKSAAECSAALKEKFGELKGATDSLLSYMPNVERDVPLSPVGILQADSLRTYVETGVVLADSDSCPGARRVFEHKDKHVCSASAHGKEPLETVNSGKPGQDVHKRLLEIVKSDKTVFATSNLRRALLTLLIVFNAWVSSSTLPKIHILSALQEISGVGGRDASSRSSKGGVPALGYSLLGGLGRSGTTCPYHNFMSKRDSFDATCNVTPRFLTYFKPSGEARLNDFCNWARKQVLAGKEHLVITGHSSWLKHFMADDRHAEPDRAGEKGCNSVLRESKLSNASMIQFTLKFTEGTCRVVGGSTKLLFGGFAPKIKKIKKPVTPIYASEDVAKRTPNRGKLEHINAHPVREYYPHPVHVSAEINAI